MDPKIANISEENDIYRFTLSGIDVSIGNAIRRIILNDIPTVVIRTESEDVNQCYIEINTGRLHNEIVKQRLSCIPIHMKELDLLPGKYILDIDVLNESDTIIMVTTEDFRIKNKESGNYLTKEETRRIFPACTKTAQFVDFIRLRPKIDNSIQGEQIKLTADFSVACVNDNSMFNVVSKCAYGNTPDHTKIEEEKEKVREKLANEGLSKTEIEFHLTNFRILDAQRHFVPNSFDFAIRTVGVFENKDIIKKACEIMVHKLAKFMDECESDTVPILNSATTMENCYDVKLENEDYTLGKVLEYFLYERYFQGTKEFTFCGFKKLHPHDTDSIIRIAMISQVDKNQLKQYLMMTATNAIEVFKKIRGFF
jgi:DNA-directed RNA polymerase subunit L